MAASKNVLKTPKHSWHHLSAFWSGPAIGNTLSASVEVGEGFLNCWSFHLKTRTWPAHLIYCQRTRCDFIQRTMSATFIKFLNLWLYRTRYVPSSSRFGPNIMRMILLSNVEHDSGLDQHCVEFQLIGISQMF